VSFNPKAVDTILFVLLATNIAMCVVLIWCEGKDFPTFLQKVMPGWKKHLELFKPVVFNFFWPMDHLFFKKCPTDHFAMPTPHQQLVATALHILV